MDIHKLRGLNQQLDSIKDIEERKCYIYDYYIQLNLSVFDGGNYLQKDDDELDFQIETQDPKVRMQMIKEKNEDKVLKA